MLEKNILIKEFNEPIKSIQIIGKRWFQRSYGNTYYSVQILVNNKLVYYNSHSPGYGEMYLQDAKEYINQYIFPFDYEYKNSAFGLREYCKQNDIVFINIVTDVSREKDL